MLLNQKKISPQWRKPFFGGSCSLGWEKIYAALAFRGVEQPTHTTFLCRRSCCNRPGEAAVRGGYRKFIAQFPSAERLARRGGPRGPRHGAVWDNPAGRGRDTEQLNNFAVRGFFPLLLTESTNAGWLGCYIPWLWPASLLADPWLWWMDPIVGHHLIKSKTTKLRIRLPLMRSSTGKLPASFWIALIL